MMTRNLYSGWECIVTKTCSKTELLLLTVQFLL